MGHWKIMTILGAMSLRGMVATMTIEEATDADTFLGYVEHVMYPALGPGDVVVMDNLSSHKLNGVHEWIEKAGAKLKQLLRSTKARTKEALDQAIEDALKLISAENARAWFNHCFEGL